MLRYCACLMVIVPFGLTAGCRGIVLAGSGVTKTETRTVEAFREVEVQGVGTIEVEVGPAHGVQVTIDDNLLPIISTVVSGERLTIRPTQIFHSKPGLKVRVTTPELTEVSAVGAATMSVAGMTGPALSIRINGAAQVSAVGTAGNLAISVNGAGRVLADGLSVESANVSLTGAGSAEVRASNSLAVNVVGAGQVTYAGSPTISQTLVGAGRVIKRD